VTRLSILLRSAVFNALFFLMTFMVCFTGLALLPLPRPWLRRHVQRWARLIMWLLKVVCSIHLRVTGWENLPPGAVVIAAKHQSAYDTVVWLALLPDPVYVLKKELLRIPLWGLLARRYGAVAVDRQGGASALKQMVRDGCKATAEGSQVIIFPEGTRTVPGQRVPYQPGVVALASATGKPVVPVATDSGIYWGRRAFAKRPGTVTLALLPALPGGLNRQQMLAGLTDAIETESDRLLLHDPYRAVDNSVG
jgi:1-acyl-sn-glycerol-3-phosphate acyltransferase